MTWNVISVDYKEENAPVEARLQDASVNVQIDGGELRTKLRINTDVALDLADKIRTAAEEKNFEQLEEYILHLENRVEDLENQLEIKDEVIENLRNRR